MYSIRKFSYRICSILLISIKEQETRAIGENEIETSESHGSSPKIAESSENPADGDANQNTENNSDDNSGKDLFQTLCRSKRLRNFNQPNFY